MESSNDTNTTISSSKSGVLESNLDSSSPKEKPCFVGESILKTLLMSPTSSKNFKQCFKYSFHNNSSNLSDNTAGSVIVKKDKEPFQYDDQTNSISTTDLRNKFVSRNVTSSITTATSLKQVNSFINKFGSELVSVDNIILKNDEFNDSSKVILMPVKQDSNKISKVVVRHFGTDLISSEKQEAAENVEEQSCDTYYQDEDSNECIPSLNVEVQLKEGHGTYNTENMEGLYSDNVTADQVNDADSKSDADGMACDRDLRCTVCRRQFNFRKNMNKHLRHMHGIGRFTCAVCRAEFDKRRDLIKHRDLHSENGVAGGGYRCEDCGKVVAWYNHFVAHRRTHETNPTPTTPAIVSPVRGGTDHACAECAKTFRSAAGLRVHQRTHTGEKPFACLICGVTFAQKRIQVDHMNKHTGARPYRCPSCPETFSNYITFNVHKRTRHNVTPEFACDICGAGFVWKSNLESHLRSHSREKVYECKECDRTFTHRNSLAYHKRVHAASLPFKCLDCPDSFRSCSHLAEHRANKHSDQPRPCTDCGGTFAGPASLARHRKDCEAVKKSGDVEQTSGGEQAKKSRNASKTSESIEECTLLSRNDSSAEDKPTASEPEKRLAGTTTKSGRIVGKLKTVSKLATDIPETSVNEPSKDQAAKNAESTKAAKSTVKKYPKKKSTAVRNMEATVARNEASKQALMIMITKLESAKRARTSEVGESDSIAKKLKAITDSRLEKSLSVVREVSLLIAKPELGDAIVDSKTLKVPSLASEIGPLSKSNLPNKGFLSILNLAPVPNVELSNAAAESSILKTALKKPAVVSVTDSSEGSGNDVEAMIGTYSIKKGAVSSNSIMGSSKKSSILKPQLPLLVTNLTASKLAQKSLLKKSMGQSASKKEVESDVSIVEADSIDSVLSKSDEVSASSNYKPKKSLIEIFKPATKDKKTRLQILDTFLAVKTDEKEVSKQFMSESEMTDTNPVAETGVVSSDINDSKPGVDNDSILELMVPEHCTLGKSGNKVLAKPSIKLHEVSRNKQSAQKANQRQNKVPASSLNSKVFPSRPRDLKETYPTVKSAHSSSPLSISIPTSLVSVGSPYSPIEITIKEGVGEAFAPLNLVKPFVDQLPKLKEGNRGVSVIRKRRVNPSLMSSDRKVRKTKMNAA